MPNEYSYANESVAVAGTLARSDHSHRPCSVEGESPFVMVLAVVLAIEL
jgi:hypothetical protein